MFFIPFNSSIALVSDKEDVMEEVLFGEPMKFIEQENTSSDFVDIGKKYSPINESILRRSKTTPPLKKLRMKITKTKQAKKNLKEKNEIDKKKDNIIDFESFNQQSEIVDYEKEGIEIAQPEEENEVEIQEKQIQNVIISSDNMDYYHSSGVMYASGNVVIDFVNQDAKIKAENLDYMYNDNLLYISGDVRIIKGEQVVTGNFIKIDLNTENVIINNPHTKSFKFDINAKQAYLHGNDLIQEDGNIEVSDNYLFSIKPTGKLRYLRTMLVKEEDKTSIVKNLKENVLKIKVEKLTLDAQKEHNILYLKNAEFYINDEKVVKIPRIRFCTNKTADYYEGSYMEVGSRQDVGTYFGPGLTFLLPKGAALKVAPLFVVKDKAGVGGLAKFKNGTNETALYYGTSQSLWVLKGKQKLDDNLYLQYGINHYLDDWFLGRLKPKYGFDLVYGRAFESRNFLNKNLTARVTTRSDFGYFQDSYSDHHYTKLKGNEIGTLRAKTMLEGLTTFYSYINKEEAKVFNLSLVAQGSAALYGTGDTQFIGRIGPRAHMQYKRWMQELGYFQSVYSDNTPMPVFDAYRYGRSNIYAREYFRLTNYLTIALMGALNLSSDYYDKNRISEFGVYASIGPDDLRLNVGYDFVRERAYINVMSAMDMKGAKLSYDKMVIKNPENLELNTDDNMYKEVVPDDQDELDKPVIKKQNKYAQVVEIGEYDDEL